MQAGPVISLSPSFNSYSNTRLAEIAARVVEEFQSEDFYDEFYLEREDDSEARLVQTEEDPATRPGQPEENSEKEGGDEDDEDDGEFEFAFVTRDSELPSPIPADEIFLNGQIRPVYPVFNREFFFGDLKFQKENGKESGVPGSGSDSEKGPKIRLPLRKLFVEERETALTTSSSSSSEADDLEGLPADSYCVWRPKAAEERCKKSSSTGSISKRWKLKGLLQRNHSDGKDSFVFLGPSNSGRKKENDVKVIEAPAAGGKDKPTMMQMLPPPYNPAAGEKRRSYLPYRQDLVGFFSNVNSSSKNLQPY